MQNGGLYGMSGFAYLNEQKTLYDYTSIDTECGQSGASLFVDLTHLHANGQERIAIVGIHVLGAIQDGANQAVALNKANLDWVNQSVNNIFYDTLMSISLENQMTLNIFCRSKYQLC